MSMTEDATNDAITSGLEQMNAVIKAWWTLPDAGAPNVSEAPMQQVTDFASDLQQIYSDTFERHRDLLMQGMTELASWAPATTQAGQPQGAMEVPLKMMASLLESSSKRAEIWTDMSRQLGARYAVLAHQLAHDIDQTTDAPANEPPKATSASKRKKRVE